MDPTTRTLKVRVVLENPHEQLKPAMFGVIRILHSSSQGILVPSSAVIREGNDSYVFLAKGNGHFERRTVRLGRSFESTVEIAAGLKAGDTIVSDGALLLRAASRD